MQRNIITIESFHSIKNAARIMVRYGISCLLVLEKGQLRGIITEQDIVSRIVVTCQNPNKVCVGDIMSEPLIVVYPSTSIEEAARIMVHNRIRKLPIIKGTEKGPVLVG